MSKKSLAVLGIVLVVVVIVLYFVMLGGGEPGGPIIVLQPEPDPGAGGAQTGPYTYTGWYAGCPAVSGASNKAVKDDSFFGVPGRYSSKLGAESMRVTVIANPSPQCPFAGVVDAAKVDVNLDSSSVPLTIALPLAKGVPTWNQGKQVVPFNGQKPMYAWSGQLYGHIKSVTVAALNGKTGDVDVADLESVEIRYLKPKYAKTCQ